MQLKLFHLRILLFLCGLSFGGHALTLWIRLGNYWGRTYLNDYPAHSFALVIFTCHALLAWWQFLATARARMTRVSTINTCTQVWLMMMAMALVAVAVSPRLMNYAAVALTADPNVTTEATAALAAQTIVPAILCVVAVVILFTVQRRVQSQLVDDIQIIAKHPTDRCGIAFSTALITAIICGRLARNFYVYRTSVELDNEYIRYNDAIVAYQQRWLPVTASCIESPNPATANVLVSHLPLFGKMGTLSLAPQILVIDITSIWPQYDTYSKIPADQRTKLHSLLCTFKNTTTSQVIANYPLDLQKIQLYNGEPGVNATSLQLLDIIVEYQGEGEGEGGGGTGPDDPPRPAQIKKNSQTTRWMSQSPEQPKLSPPQIMISTTEDIRLRIWFDQLYAKRDEYHGAIATSKSLLYAQINFTIALLALCTAVAFAIRCEIQRRRDPHGSDMQDFVTIKMRGNGRGGQTSSVAGTDEIALPDTSEWETASVTDDKFTIEDIGTDGVEEL